MKELPQHATGVWSAFSPLDAWLHGFDYAFGYQLKLVQAFWGIAREPD